MKKKRERFSRQFRQDSVNHLISSQKSIKDVASDLGIELHNLRRWNNEFMEKSQKQNSKPEDPAAKLIRLEKENYQQAKEIATLKQERDILKKAVGIVSKQ